MNTTNKFFETKQQYLAFRSAFAAAQNDPRAKKGEPDEYGVKAPGWLTAAHFMLLNLVRGYPRTRGFKEITSKVKLDNGMPADLNIRWASRNLTFAIVEANQVINNEPCELNSWEIPKKFLGIGKDEAIKQAIEAKTIKRNAILKEKLDKFLAPFAGTFTIVDLAKLEGQTSNTTSYVGCVEKVK